MYITVSWWVANPSDRTLVLFLEVLKGPVGDHTTLRGTCGEGAEKHARGKDLSVSIRSSIRRRINWGFRSIPDTRLGFQEKTGDCTAVGTVQRAPSKKMPFGKSLASIAGCSTEPITICVRRFGEPCLHY